MAGLTKEQQSRIGKRSRRKGKSFEQWCARFFRKWFEGKWETTRNSGRTDLHGDIYRLDAPDMPFVVECKHDKKYTIKAMAKPTEAIKQLVRKYRRRQMNLGWDWTLLLVVKNEAGVWVAMISNNNNLSDVLVGTDVVAIVTYGIYFFKLEQSIYQLKKILTKTYKLHMEQLARDAGVKSKGVDNVSKVGACI